MGHKAVELFIRQRLHRTDQANARIIAHPFIKHTNRMAEAADQQNGNGLSSMLSHSHISFNIRTMVPPGLAGVSSLAVCAVVLSQPADKGDSTTIGTKIGTRIQPTTIGTRIETRMGVGVGVDADSAAFCLSVRIASRYIFVPIIVPIVVFLHLRHDRRRLVSRFVSSISPFINRKSPAKPGSAHYSLLLLGRQRKDSKPGQIARGPSGEDGTDNIGHDNTGDEPQHAKEEGMQGQVVFAVKRD